jgi:hypothetical protein
MACQGGSEPHDALGQSAAVHDAAVPPGLTMSGQSVPHLFSTERSGRCSVQGSQQASSSMDSKSGRSHRTILQAAPLCRGVGS